MIHYNRVLLSLTGFNYVVTAYEHVLTLVYMTSGSSNLIPNP